MHMHKNWTRRRLLKAALSIGATTLATAPRVARATERPQRTIIVMCDGFGLEYYDRSPMPTLSAWAAGGGYLDLKAGRPVPLWCQA
jgi:hypothetical protein